MDERFLRTELLLGRRGMEKLALSRVAVFGIGGVGGYAAEALARSGVGALDLVDSDTISITNINRQIIATQKTLGRYKTDVAAERIADISPECVVRTYKTFFLPQTANEFDFGVYDYVVDAIDTVAGKVALVRKAEESGTLIISSMGAGNKLDPTQFRVGDIFETSVCPLARVMRRELAKCGIERLKVVYSMEKPIELHASDDLLDVGKKRIPGSVAFVPSVAGLIIAGEVIKDLVFGVKAGENL